MNQNENALRHHASARPGTDLLERMALPGWSFAVVGPGWQKFDFAFAREAWKYAREHGGTEIYSFHSGEYLMRDGKLTDYGHYVLQDGPLPDRLRPKERLRAPSAMTRPGLTSRPVRLDLRSLRSALRGRQEILESLEAGVLKATGRPGVNVGMLWQLTTRAMYASADIPVLAVRELLQNSVDAIRAAVASRQLRRGDGRFDVIWNAGERSLTASDNGIGMSAQDITDRFLVLGASGKTSAENSEVAAGGFGVAKAVILGAASRFRWRLHTRDNLAVSQGTDQDVQIFEAEQPRAGTAITLLDVSPEYDVWWDSAGGGPKALDERIRELLAANDLPDLTITYNGKVVSPLFARRGGSRIQVAGSWGEGTAATVKAYKRSDRRGAYWVRLNGLAQFKAASSADLGVDVVVDLASSVRPGQSSYPLNASRDSLQGQARYVFRAVQLEVEKENLSAGDKEEDEVFDPEPGLDPELAGDVAALRRSMLEDPELAKLLGGAGVLAPELAVGKRETASDRVDEGAAGTGGTASAGGADGASGGSRILQTNLPDNHVLDLRGSRGRLSWFPRGLQTPAEIEGALNRAEASRGFAVEAPVREALKAARGGAVTVAQLRTLAEALQAAALSVAKVEGRQTPRVQVSERHTRQRHGNPFGSLGALRISQSYPKERARALKRNPHKWLPYLLLWDITLKLMMEAGGIQRLVKPGFVLEDGTIGMAQRRAGAPMVVIYIHPDRLAETAERHKLEPMAIAGFLHGVAAHELAHADGLLGEGHSQHFVSAREDLGHRTAHLLPRLATLAVKLLKLPVAKDETVAKLSRLEKQLAEARDSRDGLRAEKAKVIKRLERELASCRAMLQGVAEKVSAQARAACSVAGACESEPVGVPAVVEVVGASTDSAVAEPSARATKVLETLSAVLLASPPAGVEPAYIARFFARYSRHLGTIVDLRLGTGGQA